MKKLFFALLILTAGTAATAQNVTKDSAGNYHAIKAEKVDAKLTGKTYTDSKGNVFPVSVSAKGKLFIIKIAKSGRAYIVYLKEQP